MFSYLHGIRPNNRRSGTPPVVFPQYGPSSRYYHEDHVAQNVGFELPQRQASQPNSLNESSPVSPDPPILPPIPRVASQREPSIVQERRPQGLERWPASSNTQEHASQGAAHGPRILATSNSQDPAVAGIHNPHESRRDNRMRPPALPHGHAHHPSQRQKRPIDLAYESMRSFSEPPFRQSMATSPERLQLPPQPYRPAPPPPTGPAQSQYQFQAQGQIRAPHQPQPQRRAPLAPPIYAPQQVPLEKLPTSNRPGKAKLNLLNPMSLLARRRSSQAVAEAYSQNQSTPGTRLPDDYDPRIRGKVVHDFSAPRPGRNLVSNDRQPPAAQVRRIKGPEGSENQLSTTPGSMVFAEEDSPSSTEKEHAPVFKEHFDDNTGLGQDGPSERQSEAFIYKMSLQAVPDAKSLPTFARSLPPTLSSNIETIRKTSSPPPKAPLRVVPESPLPEQNPTQLSAPISPPSKARSRAASINDPASPQRFKSNASRFSFDLAGVGSAAQEKLLEDKHRQNARRKDRTSVTSNDVEEEDDYDYDDMHDDVLEEEIPGVNPDQADDEQSRLPVSQEAREHFTFVPPSKSSFESAASHASTGRTSPGTPRDVQDQLVGFAVSKKTPHLAEVQTGGSEFASGTEHVYRQRSTPGGASDSSLYALTLQRNVSSAASPAGLPHQQDPCNDDMYFDDGIIEDLDESEYPAFDESVFDDSTGGLYGLPLRDRKLKPLPEITPKEVNADEQPLGHGLAPQNTVLRDKQILVPSPRPSMSSGDTAAELRDALTDLNPPIRPLFSHTAGLTQENLAAVAAALAGNQSCYSDESFHQHSVLDEDHHDFGLSPDIAPNDPDMNGFAISEDDFDTDDDDAIVAAANAEALENDDDGFYGQEFGFYARASNSSDTEYANGGYFGPRALEGMRKNRSGRTDFNNMTPITERSEWSNRNSMVSLATHVFPIPTQSFSSPPLADLMHLSQEDLSMAALQRARRGAWGGSTASLQSSSNSQHSGSPLTYVGTTGATPSLMLGAGSNQNLESSFHSFTSSNGPVSSNDSDPSPSVDSPTITFSTSQPGHALEQPNHPPRSYQPIYLQ